MKVQKAEAHPDFKDYFLILQVHPEADAGMVDAAYWHLARRYKQEAEEDPLAKARLDDLNEAYSVLGSPTRREEYVRVRNAVLGEGRLPEPRQAAPGPAPLQVMERGRAQQPQSEPASMPRRREFRLVRLIELSWQNALLVFIALTAAAAALIAELQTGVVLALLLVAMAICGIPLVRTAAATPLVSRLLSDDRDG